MKHVCCMCLCNVVARNIETPLAQSVERQAFNLVVVGSIPTWGVVADTKLLEAKNQEEHKNASFKPHI